MSAALDLFAMEGVHPVDVDGQAGRVELARTCSEMWAAAVVLYMRDCRQALRGIATADLEALDDLTGSRELLANLCEPIGADVDVVADAIGKTLNAG